MASLLLLPLPALLLACDGPAEPLVEVDRAYTEIAVDLGIADRDTARNVRNAEARARKDQAEKARVAFFQQDWVQAAIASGLEEPPGNLPRVKAEAYARESLTARAWTAEQKAEENRLLARLEAARTLEASWTSPDGALRLPLTGSWADVAKAGRDLPPEQLASLAQDYVDHHLAALGEDLVALVRLRNEVARAAGFPSYWELALQSQGLQPAQVDEVIADLSGIVAPLHRADLARIEAVAQGQGRPVDFAHLPLLRVDAGLEAGRAEADAWFDADEAEARVTTALRDLGIETRGWQVYAGPQRLFRSGAYGFAIRPPEHVAIVMSQDQRWSLWQYEALAHEGGHAVWWGHLPDQAWPSPVLWQPPAPWFEGFAQFFERLLYEPAFTARYVPELPADQRAALAAWRSRAMARWITDSIVQTQVERRLYAQPDDLAALQRFAAETRAALTGLPLPPTDERGLVYDEALLSSILALYPAYSQNYLFAYLTEAWLFEAVKGKVPGELVGNAAVGPVVLREIVGAEPSLGFEERVARLLPGDRSAPLKAYLALGREGTP